MDNHSHYYKGICLLKQHCLADFIQNCFCLHEGPDLGVHFKTGNRYVYKSSLEIEKAGMIKRQASLSSSSEHLTPK